MMEAEQLMNALKSKDKKIRYRVLDTIMKLSRSNKTKKKQDFLSLVLSKSGSKEWEERYIAMYTVSRFYRKNWEFEDFKKQFLNVLRLLEDKDGRVRIAARNVLDHFRVNFLYFAWGEWKTNERDLVSLWTDSLFSLWEKADSLEEGRMQLHLIQCIKILYQHDMNAYLTKKEYRKCQQIWEKVNELDNFYYEYGVE